MAKLFIKKKNVTVITIMNSPPLSIRVRGPFHERFMRLRFDSNIPNLQSERLIATLWMDVCYVGSVRKNTTWEMAKKIDLKYNEAQGEMEFKVPADRLTQQQLKRGEAIRESIEGLLSTGDKAALLVNKSNGDGVYTAMVAVETRYPYDFHKRGEYIHLAAQMLYYEIYNVEVDRAPAPVNQGESFSLLEFAFVPLRKLEEDCQNRKIVHSQNIEWKIQNTYRRQWRPLSVGILSKEAPVHNLQWLTVAEERERHKREFRKEDIAYFAAWPLQAYCKGFSTSNGMRMTYINSLFWDEFWIKEPFFRKGQTYLVEEQDDQPCNAEDKGYEFSGGSSPVPRENNEEESNEKVDKPIRGTIRQTVEVTFKVAGGTIRQREQEEGEDEPRTSEIWEPEDA
ncbi:unnamed protein product [Musa acuminata subsp. malaccensis]|nr:unnamed protein product [Musa acuminata subsp. malaccensis]